MALTAEQQAQLDALQAQAAAPEPRTETGVAGILHTLLDVNTGTLAILTPEAAAALHADVETAVGDGSITPAPAPAPVAAVEAPAEAPPATPSYPAQPYGTEGGGGFAG
jgi:hypothetical protein